MASSSATRLNPHSRHNLFKLPSDLRTPSSPSIRSSLFQDRDVLLLDDSDHSDAPLNISSAASPLSPTTTHESGVDTPPTSIIDASISPHSKSGQDRADTASVSDLQITKDGPELSDGDVSRKCTHLHAIIEMGEGGEAFTEAVEGARLEAKATESGGSENSGPRRRSTRLRQSMGGLRSYNINVLNGSARPRKPKDERPLELTSPVSRTARSSRPRKSEIADTIIHSFVGRTATRQSPPHSLATKPLATKKDPTRRATFSSPDEAAIKTSAAKQSRKRQSLALQSSPDTEDGGEDGGHTAKKKRTSRQRSEKVLPVEEVLLDPHSLDHTPIQRAEEPLRREGQQDVADDSNKPNPPARPRQKIWQPHGLYAGQTRIYEPNFDAPTRGPPKLLSPSSKERTYLPLPIFLGERLIQVGRDYQLPFDVMNLLPEEVKPTDGWTLKRDGLPKSRYIGDAIKEKPRVDKERAFCACALPSGCDDRCWNLCMKIECDETNCNMPVDKCGNRVFATKMSAPPGKRLNPFEIGLEVMRTDMKGFGVRAVRSFAPGEPIAEYTGDIITSAEAHRRQTEDYAHMKNFYMMTLRKGLIVDATKRGSITRFVNHSCNPNCTMDLRVVKGMERVALFAGDRGIQTGEEITYDYDFSPFDGTARAQECFCGEPTCRGFIEKRAAKAKASSAASSTAQSIDQGKGKAVAPACGKNGPSSDKGAPAATPPSGDVPDGRKTRKIPPQRQSNASTVIAAAMASFMPITTQKRKAKFGIIETPLRVDPTNPAADSSDVSSAQAEKSRKKAATETGQKSAKRRKSDCDSPLVSHTQLQPHSGVANSRPSSDVAETQNRKTPCEVCADPRNRRNNFVVFCDGCPGAYHQKCHSPIVTPEEIADQVAQWFCHKCREAGKKTKRGGKSKKARQIQAKAPTSPAATAITKEAVAVTMNVAVEPVATQPTLSRKPKASVKTKVSSFTQNGSILDPKKSSSKQSPSSSSDLSSKTPKTTPKPKGMLKRAAAQTHELVGVVKRRLRRGGKARLSETSIVNDALATAVAATVNGTAFASDTPSSQSPPRPALVRDLNLESAGSRRNSTAEGKGKTDIPAIGNELKMSRGGMMGWKGVMGQQGSKNQRQRKKQLRSTPLKTQ